MHPNRTYTYRCNTCRNEFTYDEPAEPLCTGPGDTDTHPPEVMWRIRVTDPDMPDKLVGPGEGKSRAEGTLLTPEALVNLRAQVKGRLWTPKDGINPWTSDEMWDDVPEASIPIEGVESDG